MSAPRIDIVVSDPRWRELAGARTLVRRAARAAFAAAGVALAPGAEASVLLSSDAAVADLNGRWRGKPVPTNVLSFPAVEPAGLVRSPVIGDIALAYETCLGEASAEQKSLASHVTHLVVHGALHLLGYDHDTPRCAAAMEGLEREILAGLGIADPYAIAMEAAR